MNTGEFVQRWLIAIFITANIYIAAIMIIDAIGRAA
tara:strand:- start:138 stop:245 length:108 start_codon:yes stop_codon:yes gene_type:complete